MKLTTHLHLAPKSKNEWSYTSTPNTRSWRGAQLKHRGNFTFTFYYHTVNTLTFKYEEKNTIKELRSLSQFLIIKVALSESQKEYSAWR
jgi:hypothetical protein